jgi:hypothetical protein
MLVEGVKRCNTTAALEASPSVWVSEQCNRSGQQQRRASSCVSFHALAEGAHRKTMAVMPLQEAGRVPVSLLAPRDLQGVVEGFSSYGSHVAVTGNICKCQE